MRDLLPRALVIRAIAVQHAVVGAVAQKLHLRTPIRHGINRKLIAQIVQRKLQPRSQRLRVGDGFGQIGEKLLHFRGRFQVAFGVARQQAPGGGQRAVMTNARKYIQQFALLRQSVANAIGRQHRQI